MGEEIAHNAINNTINNIDSNNSNTESENVQVDIINDDNETNDDDNQVMDINNDPDVIDHHEREVDLAIELEKRGKKIINDLNLRRDLIIKAHLLGHFGVQAVFNKLWHQGYWWPKIRVDIQQELINCDACNRFNVTKAGFHPFTPFSSIGPGDHFQIDLSTHLPPSSDGYTALLAVIDVFTGFVILRPLRNAEMDTVARKLWKIFCLIGWPRILQSDNGSEFVNQILRALVKLTGIDHRLISPYNPRADGKVERVIGSTMMIIKKLLHGAKHNWSIYVPFAQVTFNDKVSSLTGSSPFSLLFGRKLNELKDYTQGDNPIPISLSNWQDRCVPDVWRCGCDCTRVRIWQRRPHGIVAFAARLVFVSGGEIRSFFRAFAQDKATWILNYSWDGDKGVPPSEAMKNLAMSQIMAGANFWDAPGHSMAGSNDSKTRKEIFQWIGQHEKEFYSPRVRFARWASIFRRRAGIMTAQGFCRRIAAHCCCCCKNIWSCRWLRRERWRRIAGQFWCCLT